MPKKWVVSVIKRDSLLLLPAKIANRNSITTADCAHFMAMPITVMVGYDNVIFGKALADIGGEDGIVPDHL